MVELAMSTRADDWLTYPQIGAMGSVYALALIIGVAAAPLAARVGSRVAITVGALSAYIPLALIGLLVSAGSSAVVPVALALWALGGAGAGVMDMAHLAQATMFARARRLDTMMLFGVRQAGAVAMGGIAAWAIERGVPVAAQYVSAGLILTAVTLAALGAVPPLTEEALRRPEAGAEAGRGALVALGALAAAGVMPTMGAYYWARPIMSEVYSGSAWAGGGVLAWTCAQVIVPMACWQVSDRVDARRIARGAALVAATGVALLVPVALHARAPYLAPGMVYAALLSALAMIGGGIAVVPAMCHQAAARVRAPLGLVGRITAVVGTQCVLTAAASYGLGHAAEAWGSLPAFMTVCVVCVAGVTVGSGLLRHARPIA